jgi:hypothetical protein
MDIERKAELAGRVLIWMSIPIIVVLDLLAAVGIWMSSALVDMCTMGTAWRRLCVPLIIYGIPVLLVLHVIILIRRRKEVWGFVSWGIGPPVLILGGLFALSLLGALPQVRA